MTGLILTTFDWIPEIQSGYVRDLRVRWALEECGIILSRRQRAVSCSGCRASRAPAYVALTIARPSFVKAHADQMAYFLAADEKRQ